MWRKDFVACLRVLSRHFPGRKEEHNKYIVRQSRWPGATPLSFCRKEAGSVTSCWPRMFPKSSFNNGRFAADRNLRSVSVWVFLYSTLSVGSYECEIWGSQDAECEDNWLLVCDAVQVLWLYRVVRGACCPHYLGYRMDIAGYSEMSIQWAVVLCPFVLSLFALTPHSQFTPLLTLRYLIFGLTPFA